MNVISVILEFFKTLFSNKNSVKSVSNSAQIVENKPVIKETKTEVVENQIVIENSSINMSENEVLNIENEIITPKKQYSGLVVVLDPGHAMSTAGKKSPFSLGKVLSPELRFEEWQFSREIAYRLKPILMEYGIEVFITTTMEQDNIIDLGLSKRAARANDYVLKSGKKGIFVSIHADADGMGDKWTKAHGWSCFTTKGQNNSDILADCLYDAAEEILIPMGITIRTDKKDGDRDWEEDFTVIYKANMPAVLTENLFYTNIDDTKFLISEEGRDAIIKIHLNGILKFAEKFYKM